MARCGIEERSCKRQFEWRACSKVGMVWQGENDGIINKNLSSLRRRKTEFSFMPLPSCYKGEPGEKSNDCVRLFCMLYFFTNCTEETQRWVGPSVGLGGRKVPSRTSPFTCPINSLHCVRAKRTVSLPVLPFGVLLLLFRRYTTMLCDS